MVNAWYKNQLREVRSTLGRFLAILGIVALGVGFFAGLKVTQPSMILTGGQYTEDAGLFDFRLISTLGLTAEDVEYFRNLPAVSVAEGANSVDLTAKKGDRELTLKAMSLSSKINKPSLSAGRMPRKANECLADNQRFSKDDIGKTLSVTALARDGAIKEEAFTIVGLASSPLYLSINRGTTTMGGGSLDGFLFLRKEAFDGEYFSELYLRLKDVDRTLYSESYEQSITDAKPLFTRELENRAQYRYDTIIGDATTLLNDAKQQYEDGLEEYHNSRAEAEAQLAQALQELNDGAAEIEANRKTLSEGEKQLADAKKELAQGKQDYAAGVKELAAKKADAQKQFANAQAEIDKNQALVDAGMVQAGDTIRTYKQLLDSRQRLESRLAGMNPDSWLYPPTKALLRTTTDAIALIESSEEFPQLQQLMDAQAQLQTARETLEAKQAEADAAFADAQRKLDAAAAEITRGESEIAASQQEIDAGKAALAEAEETLEAGRQDYAKAEEEANQRFADAQAQLETGKQAIADAELELEKLEHPDVFLLARDTNPGYLSFRSDSGIVDGIAKVFPLFFFMVAAFVCITTMTRMVDEHRTQIGTLKALGYTDSQITAKYILYAGSAATIGAVLGFLLGTRLFPWVIWECYNILYGFAPLRFYFSLPMALVSLAAALVCSVGATWFACRAELRKMPSQLMRPKAPKAGKRILLERVTILWNRFSFLYKVSIRNIVRYKKRLFMMLMGIGGCTALIVTGCGVKDSIANIANYQFEDVTHYDVSVTFSVPLNTARQEEFRKSYPDMTECVFLGYYSYDTVHSQGISTVYVIATDDQNLTNTVSLRHDGTTTALPEDGAAIDAALANLLGIGIGDKIPIRVSDTKTVEVPVVGLFDNHLYHYAVMSAQTFTALFDQECEYQTAYVCTDSDAYALGREISNYSRTAAVTVMDSLRATVDNMMKSLNAMVFVVIGSACALAFIVIYNLTNITINERVREIATIKVLGFYPRETVSYVSREIVMLTILGALIGLPLGKALHGFVMSQITIDMVSFTPKVLPLSYVLAFAITIGMEIITGLLLQKKITNVNMAESLKSVE